jgi:hypothetical protein
MREPDILLLQKKYYYCKDSGIGEPILKSNGENAVDSKAK